MKNGMSKGNGRTRAENPPEGRTLLSSGALESAQNRRLIRPMLGEAPGLTARIPRRKPVPPEQTNAESFYYLKQMASRTPMVVVLADGEELRGWIEWYDKSCIKVNRRNAPNLLIMKRYIRYMYKEEELYGKRDE